MRNKTIQLKIYLASYILCTRSDTGIQAQNAAMLNVLARADSDAQRVVALHVQAHQVQMRIGFV